MMDRNINVPLAKTEILFRSYRKKIKRLLPAASKTSLSTLMQESEFVDLHKLLPKNRTPVQYAPYGREKYYFGPLYESAKSKKRHWKINLITSLDLCVRVFPVCQMYKAITNLELAIPLFKYLDHVCMLAEAKRSYKISQLLSDEIFLLARSTWFYDPNIWCRKMTTLFWRVWTR